MSDLSLNLVVIRSSKIKSSLGFYEALGLDFTPERHGTGPEHFAATVDGTVFELYPAGNAGSSKNVRIGFSVDSVDTAVERLTRDGGRVVSVPADSPWGRRAVVDDPDGIRVELVETRRNNPV